MIPIFAGLIVASVLVLWMLSFWHQQQDLYESGVMMAKQFLAQTDLNRTALRELYGDMKPKMPFNRGFVDTVKAYLREVDHVW